MFCPKCGTQNPDDGKFCRGCGANLSNVLAFVDGTLSVEKGLTVENNPTELYSTGIRNTILGAGFLAVGMLLFTIPGSTFFWVLMLIPAFCLIASGASRMIKSEAIKKERAAKTSFIRQPTFAANQPIKELPPTQADYIKPPNSIYKTDYKTDYLVGEPPSVTEPTTRQLQIDAESETMTLPKK